MDIFWNHTFVLNANNDLLTCISNVVYHLKPKLKLQVCNEEDFAVWAAWFSIRKIRYISDVFCLGTCTLPP